MTRARANGFLFCAVVILVLGQPASLAPVDRRMPGGVLEGKVLFKGSKIPEATIVQNTTNPEECGKVQSLENVIVSPRNRGIKDVVAVLRGVPLPADYRPQTSRLNLDNRECRFRPHVAVLTTGSSIEAVNSDPIFHTVHLYGFRNLNLALFPLSSKVVYAVRRPGMIVVKCDMHGWMQAYIRVDDHPFHSVSDVDGGFRIEGIPPGSYTLEVWHESFGRKATRVTVEEGSVSRVTIYYRSS